MGGVSDRGERVRQVKIDSRKGVRPRLVEDDRLRVERTAPTPGEADDDVVSLGGSGFETMRDMWIELYAWAGWMADIDNPRRREPGSSGCGLLDVLSSSFISSTSSFPVGTPGRGTSFVSGDEPSGGERDKRNVSGAEVEDTDEDFGRPTMVRCGSLIVLRAVADDAYTATATSAPTMTLTRGYGGLRNRTSVSSADAGLRRGSTQRLR